MTDAIFVSVNWFVIKYNYMILHKPEGYKELLVYKRAEELRLDVRKLTEKLSYNEKRRIVHLNDSARSVKQNIVEGWKRSTTQEYYDFLSFSLGSLAEIKEDIKDLYQDKIISKETADFFFNKCRELDYLLNRLRLSLQEKMAREGTSSIKDRFNQNRSQEQQNQKDWDKYMEGLGFVHLENGQYVKRDKGGEMGDKGEKGK